MINSIMKLGQFRRQQSEFSDPIEKYLQDPIGDRKGIILSIVLEERDQDGWHFSKIDYEDFESKKINKILFRVGSSRGANITPSANITEIEKTFKVKISGWFSSFIKNKENKTIFGDKFSFVEAIYHAIENEKKIDHRTIEENVFRNKCQRDDAAAYD